jgi:hypothetical protein
MLRVFVANKSRSWLLCLALTGLLAVLSACGAPPAKPAVWTNYQGNVFAMNYYSSWGVGTKDLYLGTSYPQLEMLQGMAFTSPDTSTTFVQVIYSANTDGKASVSDLLTKHILGTQTAPVAATKLTTTTLGGVTWTQGVVQKQVTAADGSTSNVQETALGVSRVVSAGQTEIYLIIYQNQTGSSASAAQSYLTRMINSFKFAS